MFRNFGPAANEGRSAGVGCDHEEGQTLTPTAVGSVSTCTEQHKPQPTANALVSSEPFPKFQNPSPNFTAFHILHLAINMQ